MNLSPNIRFLALSLLPIRQEKLGMIPPRDAEVSRVRAQWASKEREKKKRMGSELTCDWTTVEKIDHKHCWQMGGAKWGEESVRIFKFNSGSGKKMKQLIPATPSCTL